MVYARVISFAVLKVRNQIKVRVLYSLRSLRYGFLLRAALSGPRLC